MRQVTAEDYLRTEFEELADQQGLSVGRRALALDEYASPVTQKAWISFLFGATRAALDKAIAQT